MEVYNLYKDISLRTKGEIFLGVVGPVRTGKSTFNPAVYGTACSSASGGFQKGSSKG